jgi:phosphatidylglycerol---prolipoprotein diacylglyceryl transferase
VFPIIQLGPIALQTPGLIWIAGIWLGLWAAEKSAKQAGLNSDLIYNLVLISFGAGVLGARLGYGVQYLAIFSSNWLNIFSPTLTMLNLEAGLTVGLIAAAVYGQRKKMTFWKTLDVLTPGLSIFLIAFHMANLASGEAFGTQAVVPWAVDLWGQLRHPIQVYEGAASVAIAFAFWPRKRPLAVPGTAFWLFLALTSLSRLFFDFFRGDSSTLWANIHLPQLLAWFILAIALWQLGLRLRSDQQGNTTFENKTPPDSPA